LIFIAFDTLATIRLYIILFVPAGAFGSSIYLRLLRLLRGMYMLRMLRVFRFFTYESFVYSLPQAVLAVALVAFALSMESMAAYIGIALLVELGSRFIALHKVLPKGRRKNVEYIFVAFDFLTTLALFNLVDALPQWVALLRVLRILVMFNPLGSLILAARQVSRMPEVRKESGMLMSMLVLLTTFSGSMVYFIYPQMDLSGDGVINTEDN